MNRKAIIFGIKGLKLTIEEKNLLKQEKPWGIILFSRNIKDLVQLKLLIDEIKNCLCDDYYPILIDQEGGRVSRLNKIFDLRIFAQEYFGKMYMQDRKSSMFLYQIYIDALCNILKNVGININTVPVLDIKKRNSSNIIGNRSFSNNSYIVSALGNFCVQHHEKNKIATVAKHIPGHGGALSDSHFKLPVISTKRKELINKDFKPFKFCNYRFAITAHVVYSDYDPIHTATHSKIIINNIIRKHINFKGLLISDDISMKALRFGLIKNATKALKAGCNLVLHCNGNFKEMKRLVKFIPRIDRFTETKTSDFYNFLR